MPLGAVSSGVLVAGGFLSVGTMSSGSSGKRVTVPEPSRSMFCLMSLILDYVVFSKEWN